jgi:IS5 family transposase
VRRNADDGEPLSGQPRHRHHDRYDCGRDDHPRALFDEELRRQARSRDVSDQEKGKQWYFSAKARIGVDSKETIVHSVATSAASVADKNTLPDLLHGNERSVWGDAAYQGPTDAIRAAAPEAQDRTSRRT